MKTRAAEVRAMRTATFEKNGISRARDWSYIAPIYGLDPVARAEDRNIINLVEEISNKSGLPPEAVLETLETNLVSKNQITLLENAKRTRSQKEQERLSAVQNVIRSAVAAKSQSEKYDSAMTSLRKKMSKSSGSLRAVKEYRAKKAKLSKRVRKQIAE